MANNTTLPVMSGGDVNRSIDHSSVKTSVIGLDLNPAGAESLMAGVMPSAGDVASGATDTGNPLSVGLRAATTLPTAVADGQRIKAMGTKFGQAIVILDAPRELVVKNAVTLSNTTTETTVLAAIASTFQDVTDIIISNGGNVLTRVDIRDDTAGTVMFSVYAAPGGGGGTFKVKLSQTAVNKNWTAQCSVASTDVRVLMRAVKTA